MNPSSKSNLKAHLFICTQNRLEGESCAAKGSEDLRKTVKELLKGRNSELRINSAGCLGRCSEGVAGVCYPQGEWKTQMQNYTAEEISDWVLNLAKK